MLQLAIKAAVSGLLIAALSRHGMGFWPALAIGSGVTVARVTKLAPMIGVQL